MDFYEAKKSIDSLNRFGSVLGLDNIYELLKRLGNPQDKIKVIHVAGTNGKGSTIAYISSILKKADYKVGKYTSPVVFEYLEKYQIDDVNMEEQEFARMAEKVMSVAETMSLEGVGQPTIFEVETAMAYLYFYESKCDVAIIETGMGGDTDATNVCKRVLASVIVSVSLDHTGFLGSTLSEIAVHKAGIIKEGCPVILYGQSEEVTSVVRQCAEEKNAPFIVANTDVDGMLPMRYEATTGNVYTDIMPVLVGVHQLKNVCTAIEVVEQLKKQGYCISEEAVVSGINQAVWHGRFECICDVPKIIIDGAHNPGAVSELKATLEKYYKGTKFVFIMGVLADKDFTSEIDMIAHMASHIITVSPDNPRALDGEKLAEAIINRMSCMSVAGIDVHVAKTIEEAVEEACVIYDRLDGDKAILAFGSLSYLGSLKKCVDKRNNV